MKFTPPTMSYTSSHPDIEGLEALKEAFANTCATFPDFQVTIEEIVIEGNTSAIRFTWRGTHKGKGEYRGIAPTGKQVIVTGCSVYHFVGSKIVEEQVYMDHLGLFQQLDAVPPIGQGEE